MASNGIKQDPQIKNKINKEACYDCKPGISSDLCKTFPSTIDNEECLKACRDQYGAKTYFYDKDQKGKGTLQCYCGQTKADCDISKYATEACTKNSKKECILVPGTIINDEQVPRDITSDKQCRDECNKILRADGLYCDNKCVCTNPSISPVDPDEIKKIEKHIRSTCDSKDTLFCTDTVTPVQTEKTAQTDIFPKNYFKYGPLLPNETSVKNAFCGCDQSIIVVYNDLFPTSPKPTLGKIWQEAVNNIQVQDPNKSDKTTELYSEFVNVLIKYASYPNEKRLDPKKVKALIAYEMCRVTNDKYERKKEPAKETVFTGPWLEWHLNPDSDSGKWLHRGVKILTMTMLLHILFRTILPKGINIRESLLYAMYIPHQFLQTNPYEKVLVMGGSICLMLMVMVFIYISGRATSAEWGLFGSGLGLSIAISIIGWYRDNKYMFSTGLLVPILTIIFLVIASENPISPETVRGNSKSIIGMMFLLLINGIVGIIKRNESIGRLLMFSMVLIPVLGFTLALIHFRKPGIDQGEAFIKYYIPSSFSKLPISGFAFSIYAIIIGALLTRVNLGGGLALAIYLVVFGVISALSMYVLQHVLNINIIGTSYSIIYYSILGVFIAISLLSALLSSGPRGNTYFISFVISTLFGVLPLAIFTIIINFAIANYSPAIELLFLVIYRMSGFIVARYPNSGLGKILINLLGKRSTDKWVMPFLPVISNFIKIFYYISGDNLPEYFTSTSTITGVSNTDMWLS